MQKHEWEEIKNGQYYGAKYRCKNCEKTNHSGGWNLVNEDLKDDCSGKVE